MGNLVVMEHKPLGLVYVAYSPSWGPRVETKIRCGCPLPLELLHVVQITEKRAARLLCRLEPHRLRPELFVKDPWHHCTVHDPLEPVVRQMPAHPDLLTPLQAAGRLGVSLEVFGAMVRAWDIPSTTTPGGHRRFTGQDVEAYRGRDLNSITFEP